MKLMKLALLGSVALVAASAGARAENLDALKAQIETLNARVATLEATPAVPAGYALASFSRGKFVSPLASKEYGDADYHLITIVPSADAPAAAGTTVGWTGKVSAAAGVVYTGGKSNTDIRTKMGLSVSGKTETAVGEVGASVSLQLLKASSNADGTMNAGNSAVQTDGFSGYWKMTSNLTLKGGILGRLSDSSYDWDSVATNVYFGKTLRGVSVNTSLAGDPAAMQLAYADGPMTFAIQAEDGGNDAAGNSGFGMTAKAGYTMDMFSFDVGGGYWSKTGVTGGTTDAWSVSAGAQANLGMVKIGGAIGTGVDHKNVTDSVGSLYATASLADNISLEAGITNNFSTSVSNYGVGLYYNPVKQLTLGLEGGGASNGDYSAGLVTVFRF